MKHISLLVFICVLFNTAYAQDSISLHTNFLPQHIYNQDVSQKFHMVMNFTGSDSALNTLKEKGITNNQSNDQEINIKSVITTGAYNKEHTMPVETEFVEAHDKSGKAIIPAGTKMLGTIAKNKMPIYDSVISDEMDGAARAEFLKAFKNILAQISLPDKKLAVGDTFSVSAPLNFPAGLVSFKMIFTTLYKLVNTDGNTAHFDIDIKYTMAMDYKQVGAKGSGSGQGFMILDLKNHYPLQYTSDYVMSLNAIRDHISFHISLDGSSDSKNVISKK